MRIWASPFPQMSKTLGCCMQTCTNTAKNRTELSSSSLPVLKPVALGTLEHPQPCSERVCVCVNHEALALYDGAQRAPHPSHVTHLARAHCWDLLLWQQQIIWFWVIGCVYVCVLGLCSGGMNGAWWHTHVRSLQKGCLPAWHLKSHAHVTWPQTSTSHKHCTHH